MGTKCSLLTQASLSYAVEHRALGLSTQFVLTVGPLVPWVSRNSSAELSPAKWHGNFETEKCKHSKGVKNGLAILKKKNHDELAAGLFRRDQSIE